MFNPWVSYACGFNISFVLVSGAINDMVPEAVKNLVPPHRKFVCFCPIKTFADIGSGWCNQANRSC